MRAILTYHSLDGSGSAISLAPEAFRRHADWLASGKARVLPVGELLESPEENAVAVTFDDAFVNFRDVAWPLLRDRGIPVTVFVPTAHVGRTNRWPDETYAGIPELPLLDWDSLAVLAGQGVELGSHTVSHRDLRSLDDAELREELEAPAARIAEVTGRRPDVLAYPYGRADDRVVRAAGQVYRVACTDELRPLSPWQDLLRVPRLDAWYFQRPGLLERWGSRPLEWYLQLRRLGRRAHALSAWGTRRVQKRK